MKKKFRTVLLACSLLAQALPAMAAPRAFDFGVIAHPFRSSPDESMLRKAIAETDADNLAFVVANGIKAGTEPCSDDVYNERKALLDSAKNGLIVSLAASDWTECKRENGRSAAIGRLNRLRELFFADELSMGATRIPLVRQSAIAKFRSYGENARWEFGNVMFATINLPENNNHYLSAAGRNNEFEDRLIANREWLHRVWLYAASKKLGGIVLFCDGNPLVKSNGPGIRRDGFVETRQQILSLAAKFPGKVLIIHGRTGARPNSPAGILWRGNLGALEVRSPWMKLGVDPSNPALFAVVEEPAEANSSRQ
jgi:hypothetical protein